MALLDLLLLLLTFENINNPQEYILKEPITPCSLFGVIIDVMNEINGSHLNDFEEIEHRKLLIDHIIRNETLDVCSKDFFRVNPMDDTVVVIFERPYVFIFSSEYSSYIKYSCGLSNQNRNYVNIQNGLDVDFKILDSNNQFIMNNLIPNYEKELLLNWNTDSIDILCLYDLTDYDVMPESYAYRIIINNYSCKINYHYFAKTPAVPNQYATEYELKYRAKIREQLRERNPSLYNRLFHPNKEGRLSRFCTNIKRTFKTAFNQN